LHNCKRNLVKEKYDRRNRVFAKHGCEKRKRIAVGVLQKDKSKWEKRVKEILQNKNVKEEREFKKEKREKRVLQKKNVKEE
jgi:hypothetical protein